MVLLFDCKITETTTSKVRPVMTFSCRSCKQSWQLYTQGIGSNSQCFFAVTSAGRAILFLLQIR